MDKIIFVSGRWPIKSILSFAVAMIIFCLASIFNQPSTFGIFVVYVLPYFFLLAITLFLINRNRMNAFQIFLEKRQFSIKQGIRDKREIRLSYRFVKGVGFKRDIRDRLLNLSSLSLQVEAGVFTEQDKKSLQDSNLTGIQGNCLIINGLDLPDASLLKQALEVKCRLAK